MTELYTWGWPLHSAITLLLALGVFSQALVLALSVYRQPRGRRWLAESGLELALLLHILSCSLLHGRMIHAYATSLFVPSGHAALRIAAFALVALSALAVALLSKGVRPLLSIPPAWVMLPRAELLLGAGFACAYVLALLFFLARSILLSVRRYGDIKTGISSHSVKNAIDSLGTGILFYEPDGFVLLSNRCMQQLMTVLSGRIRRNGLHFYELLCAGALQDGCSRAELEGQVVCLLPDGGVWMFKQTALRVSGREYLQLTATDISERWRLTAQLQQQNEQLRRRGEALGAALETLHALSREQEIQNAKIRAHDILGQRLTLLLHTLRDEPTPAPELILSLSQGLMEDLSAAGDAPAPRDALDSLRQTFAAIGVELRCSGPLPGGEPGRLLVQILRESATNAVRHGFATQVHAQLDVSGGVYRARITNNGRAPSSAVTEGGGIGGMRSKLAPHGGTLHVQTQPDFALTISLPGGAADV